MATADTSVPTGENLQDESTQTDVNGPARAYLEYGDRIIRESPLLSMGVAAGVGFLIGALLAGRAFGRQD